ncbi:MAG: DUF3656 domain-containing protein [Cyanobacteria bacterium P01_C01_bin.89]
MEAQDKAQATQWARPELLAPAGDWDCAKAAVENGADAIYFGLDRFNARMRAHNFTEADLPALMAFLHRRGVRGYLTVNTLVFRSELGDVQQYLKTAIAAGVDAAIVQDVGLCRLIREISPDFPIHASTQMTVTSGAGVRFAEELGCNLVVLARECSLKEINSIQDDLAAKTGSRDLSMPLEVFVHGALCVAYSGQCLTSEALGGRSANRGECAQACRMTYELFADGEPVDLGSRQYLLSPQDLSGLPVLPDLIRSGVRSLKIEGRLKSPDYVASVTRVYRQALDRAIATLKENPGVNVLPPQAEERYELEMAFSRGLYTGWFEGIDNQALVHAWFGKKRGVFLGRVVQVRRDRVLIEDCGPIVAGDGIVFELPRGKEVGGRVYGVQEDGPDTWLEFGRDLRLGPHFEDAALWKTSDPSLEKEVRKTFAGDQPRFQRPVRFEIHGEIGMPLTAIARDELGNVAEASSEMALEPAHNQPLDRDRLEAQFGRLGNTPFYLAGLDCQLGEGGIIPMGEMNRMRRSLVEQLRERRSQPKRWQLNPDATYKIRLPPYQGGNEGGALPSRAPTQSSLVSAAPGGSPHPPLVRGARKEVRCGVLIRHLRQLDSVLGAVESLTKDANPFDCIYCDFENPRHYKQAVQAVRDRHLPIEIWVAPPRITKPGEHWILKRVRQSNADGYLVRNYDELDFFARDRCIGDFSLNIANPITADYYKQKFPLERLTASYDLNLDQLADLIHPTPHWYEVTIHQHMPMFHMEHCVFCAFLSDGTDYTNCGRPCEEYEVKLRDRTGVDHILVADEGCRNTVFNGKAQTGAEYLQPLLDLGLRRVRIEFVNESASEIAETLKQYRRLLLGEIQGGDLWRSLQLQNQLGVTRGQIAQAEKVQVKRKKAHKSPQKRRGSKPKSRKKG